MFSQEVGKLLIQVIKSWEVLFVTIGLVLYMFIVNYVSRSHYRPKVARVKKEKKKKNEPVIENDANDEDAHENTNDELGLEED